MKTTRLRVVLGCCVLLATAAQVSAQEKQGVQPNGARHALAVEQTGRVARIVVDGSSVIRETAATIEGQRLIELAGSPTTLAQWQERDAAGEVRRYYSISRNGRQFTPAVATSYEIKLQHGDFEPLAGANPPAGALRDGAGASLYIVQFEVQPLEEFRERIRALGGEVRNYLPHHAHIVRMSPAVRDAVEQLPFVRWVGPYHAVYRLEGPIRAALERGNEGTEAKRYRIQVFKPGSGQKQSLADAISAMGGTVHDFSPTGILLDATLTPEQLTQVASRDEVLFIGPWGPPVKAMNNVRAVGGADYVESVAGYTGLGVRGEIMDGGCQLDHPAFTGRIVERNGPVVDDSHGTSTFGIVFGDGTGNSAGRGMLPAGVGIYSMWTTTNRYDDYSNLVQSPWNCVFQSNSWGTTPFAQTYTAESAQLDRAVFDFDIVILQGQGNYTTQDALREAWGKNIVSVGGINHLNTASKADDGWYGDASVGPASDGRIKPDLSYWYDWILTTTSGSGYTSHFGGTSAATPETAGHFGLFFQMWDEGIFGNPISPTGTVFQNRPHASTAKAVMINTASSYAFSGTGADLTRVHQGWGLADVGKLYDLRNNMLIVNETDLIGNFETLEYARTIEGGAPMTDELRATLVWTDIEGTTSSSQHRINNLDLRVVSPSGTIYYGNNGLLAGNWSTSGGSANTIDTVENVFIQNPEVGNWKIDVIGAEINEDGHVETPEVDADFALVVSGGADCPAPALESAPPAIQYTCFGNDIQLSATYSDYTSLQWYHDGAPLAGETGSTLSITDFAAGDEGDYWLEATNDCVSTNTDPTQLLDAGAPSVTQQPATPSPRCAGEDAYLTVQAGGVGPFTYQWYHDGEPVVGATSATLSLLPALEADGGDYFCRISNACQAVDSDTVTMVINPAPIFTLQPADVCGMTGDTIVLTVDATPATGVFYQWRKEGETGSVGSGKTLTLSDVQASTAGDYYVLAYTLNPTCITESERGTVDVATSAVCGQSPGDMDGDGDYDLADMQRFTLCYGTDVASDFCCACANVDVGDTAVNTDDWEALETILTGPQ